jgi:putative DNA primase/helicase
MSSVRKIIERIEPEKSAWRSLLATRDAKGERPLGDERNLILALRNAPALTNLLRFNEFALRAELTRSPPWRQAAPGEAWRDDDDTALLAWLQHEDIPARSAAVAGSVALVAKDCLFHPVRAYLEGLKWDNERRLQHWLAEYLNAEANPVYLNAVGVKFMVSAVARILEPGCQVDHVLVLEGTQGTGKSRAARALARKPEWFTDDMPDIHSKDAALQLCGRWIIELAELAALRRSEIEGMKAFITRPTDVYRPPYARRAVAVPRQSVFLATTNELQYLRDPTGNRRFWPVPCGAIDVPAIERDCDQLWAEAVNLYHFRQAWHLTPEESALALEEQRERVLTTELETDVGTYLANALSRGVKEITVRELLVHALHLEPDKSDFAERAGRLGAQVAGALQRNGWAKVRTVGRGELRRTIYRPTHRGS